MNRKLGRAVLCAPDSATHAFLQRNGRRARIDAPYLDQLVHGPDAHPVLEVEALRGHGGKGAHAFEFNDDQEVVRKRDAYILIKSPTTVRVLDE